MSSSTPARDTSASLPGVADGQVRSWSRNLSAQRQRELRRLNQVERGRQFLELRSQNHLFAQMSAQLSGKPSAPEVAAAKELTTDQLRRSTTPPAVGLRCTWTPSPDELDEARGEGSGEKVEELSADAEAEDPPPKANNVGRQMLSNEQLLKFVSLPVPANKRVLCLIVRDKLSRLTSRARSYFYPTYYLFVQAIVELDSLVAAKQHCSSTEKPDRQQTTTTTTTDNSFSASSSISADMLFIGGNANSATPVTATAAGNKLSAAAVSYSDNEALADEEEEEEVDCALVSPNRLPAAVATDNSQQVNCVAAHSKELRIENRLPTDSDGDEDEEDGYAEEDGDADSDNDESPPANQTSYLARQQPTVGGNGDEEVARATATESYDIEEENLFNNEQNPFTGTYGVLLAGRRRKKAKTYLIGPNEYGYTRRNSICKLKSNVLGTQFNAISLADNDRCTIANISYETNVLGFKGPRKMRVFLAKDLAKGAKNLPETFKKNPTTVVQLRNMTPSWNVESQSYVLNFHGRVTQASVKNFQLIECDDHHHLPEGQRYQSTVLNAAGNGSGAGSKLNSMTATGDQKVQVVQVLANKDKSNRQQSNRSTETTSNGYRANNNSNSNGSDSSSDVSGKVVKSNSSLLLNNGANNIPFENLDSAGKPMSGNKSQQQLTYNSSIVMQFGRISTHEFTCDVAYPLSILQAFSIALSSFDSKLACE